MDVASKFVSRYKKDLSVENLRTKIARRKSVTQKENRHKEFRKNRGLELADVNVVDVKDLDLTVLEEVNESCVAKVPVNKHAPAKEDISTARMAMLHRFKEEKLLRKLKERREQASKGAFKCGIYKPDNPFLPPSEPAAKAKLKEKPAPPVVTRVTRSAARAEAISTRSRAPQMPVPNRVVPKGRGQSSALKMEKENQAVLTKTTKVTAATTSRLAAVAKGQAKSTAVSKPQKLMPGKQGVATTKPEPEISIKVTECETATETESPVPYAQKPSFAPENFEFQPLDGLSKYKFQPMTPTRANAFLTPSFTWSPEGKSFVFSRKHETEKNGIKQVSPPVLTVKTPVEQEMKTYASPPKECDVGTALPVTAMTPPVEVTLVKQEMETNPSPESRDVALPVGSFGEIIHSPELEMDTHAFPEDQECTGGFGAALLVSTVTSLGEGTNSPVKQEMDTETSPESREIHGILSVRVETPLVDEVMQSPVKKEIGRNTTPESKDAPAVPVLEAPPCDQLSPLPVTISMQSEVTSHDVPYFRDLLKSEIQRLTLLCREWEKRIDMDIPEDAKDLVRTTVGQSRLLITERFKQFEGLVDNCEFKIGEKKTTCTDLDGFWDMIYFQIVDVTKKFVNLEKLQGNSWQQAPVQAKKVVKKMGSTTTVNRNQADNGRAAARSRLAAIKAALRNQVKQEDVVEASVPEKPVLVNPVVFDAGFFRIESPAKLPGSLRTRTPLSGSPKSTKVLKNSDTPVTCSEEESAEHIYVSQSPVQSPRRKALFSTDEESSNHENCAKISPKRAEFETNPDYAKSETVIQVVDLSAYCVPNVRISEGVAKSSGCTEYFNLETGTSQEDDTFSFGWTSTVDDVFMVSPENVREAKSTPPRAGKPQILLDEGVKTDRPFDFTGSCTPDMVMRTPFKSEYVVTASDLIVFSPMEK